MLVQGQSDIKQWRNPARCFWTACLSLPLQRERLHTRRQGYPKIWVGTRAPGAKVRMAVSASPETRAEVLDQAQADGEEAPKHYNQAEKAKGGVGPRHREPG